MQNLKKKLGIFSKELIKILTKFGCFKRIILKLCPNLIVQNCKSCQSRNLKYPRIPLWLNRTLKYNSIKQSSFIIQISKSSEFF